MAKHKTIATLLGVVTISAISYFYVLNPSQPATNAFYAGEHLQIIDGDSFWINAHSHHPHEEIRIVGIDAAEIFSPKCPNELQLAWKARDELAYLLRDGVYITKQGKDKYNRTLGVVSTVDGNIVSTVMIDEGLARPYGGHTKRKSWCNEPSRDLGKGSKPS